MTTIRTVTTDQSNDRTAIPLPTSTPAAGLSNNEVIFWADATTSTLRAEALDNDGDAISLNFSSGVTVSVANDWTGQQNFIETTLTDAASISWAVSTNQNAKVTVTANRTVNAPTNLKAGGKYTLRIIQDGTGGRSMAYNAVFIFDNSIVPPLNTTAGASTILYFYSDGTNLYLVASSKEVIPMTGTTGDTPIWNASTGVYDLVSPGAAGTILKSNGPLIAPTYGTVSGSGDVVGPAVSVDNTLVVFDSTTGKLIQAPNATILAGTQLISDVVNPVSAQDVATKNYVDIAIREFSGTTDTLLLADTGNEVVSTGASSNVVTVPTNASVAFSVGTFISILMDGAGVTTITAASGVTLNGVSAGSGAMDGQYKVVTLQKRATNTWIVFGAIGAVA